MENDEINNKVFCYQTLITLGLLNPEGNMYFSRYFDLFGEAREAFALLLFPDLKENLGKFIILKTVKASIEYKKDFYFADKIEIQIQIRKMKEASLIVEAKFVNALSKDIHAVADQLIAFCDIQGNIISIPEEWKIKLGEYLQKLE